MQSTTRTAKNKWKKHIVCWQASGKSANAWCRENNICYKSFITWRNRLKNEESQIDNSSFLELQDFSSGCTGITICLKNISILLLQNFDEVTLIRCIRALEKL